MPGIRPCGNTNGNEQTACRSCGAGFPICDLFIMRKPASRHARGRSVLHTSCRRLGRVLLHIILRLGIGSLIYILWRTPTLRVFRWFDTLGITWWILRLRQFFAPCRAFVPAWALFSLPVALWMYAMVAWFQMALSGSDRLIRWIWLSIALTLGVGSELGQLCRLVPGTFDGRDVAFYLAGWIAAIVCTPKKEIPE